MVTQVEKVLDQEVARNYAVLYMASNCVKSILKFIHKFIQVLWVDDLVFDHNGCTWIPGFDSSNRTVQYSAVH